MDADTDGAWLSRVEAAVAPVLASRGLSLVDAQWHREGRRWVLRFFVDKPGGVFLRQAMGLSLSQEEVAALQRRTEGWVAGLQLAALSLRKQDVRCWVREPVEGRTEFSGRLLAVSMAALTLEAPEGRTQDVPRPLVTKARLVPAFDQPKRVGRK